MGAAISFALLCQPLGSGSSYTSKYTPARPLAASLHYSLLPAFRKMMVGSLNSYEDFS